MIGCMLPQQRRQPMSCEALSLSKGVERRTRRAKGAFLYRPEQARGVLKITCDCRRSLKSKLHHKQIVSQSKSTQNPSCCFSLFFQLYAHSHRTTQANHSLLRETHHLCLVLLRQCQLPVVLWLYCL